MRNAALLLIIVLISAVGGVYIYKSTINSSNSQPQEITDYDLNNELSNIKPKDLDTPMPTPKPTQSLHLVDELTYIKNQIKTDKEIYTALEGDIDWRTNEQSKTSVETKSLSISAVTKEDFAVADQIKQILLKRGYVENKYMERKTETGEMNEIGYQRENIVCVLRIMEAGPPIVAGAVILDCGYLLQKATL